MIRSRRLDSYRISEIKGTVSLAGARVVRVVAEGLELGRSDDVVTVTKSEMESHSNLFAVVSPSLPRPLIMSAQTPSRIRKWVHALTWVAHLTSQRSFESAQGVRRRRASITEIALEQVIEEGILVKKAVSSRFGRNWQRRFFKLHADRGELEYFDVSLHESIPLSASASPAQATNMSVHREAVEDGINPIWFQRQCRYTFRLAYSES